MMRKLLLHLVLLASVFGHAQEAEQLSGPKRGVNIVRMPDGTTRKVVVN